MNCQTIEKLLALHVEDDLDPAETRRVELHLATCASCQSLAAEFRASNERVRSFAAPEFDAQTFAAIRNEVLTNIKSTTEKRLIAFRFGEQFGFRKFGYAFAFALLLVSSLLAAHLISRKSHEEFATDSSVAGDKIVAPSSNQTLTPSVVLPDAQSISTLNRSENRAATRKALRRASREKFALTRSRDKHASQTEIEHPAIALSGTTNEPLPVAAVAMQIEEANHNEDSTTNDANAEPMPPPAEMLRIEIQTSDPNIRIIWLAPKNADTQKSTTGS